MPTTETDEKARELDAKKAAGQYKAWNNEINDALKREKSFRQQAQGYVSIYEGRKADEVPFAILYSNTEIMAPAVYSQRPIPIVERKYKDADPVGKSVAEVSTRTLKYLLDIESENYDSFDNLMEAAVLDALLTNRGLSRYKYVAHDQYECVYGEAVKWDKFFHGYARTWKKVPWVGFEWDMSKDEIKKNFPDKQVDFTNFRSDDDDSDVKGETKEERTGVRTFKVYEIWDKRSRKVFFFSPVYPEGPLREVPDPLELSGFFPVPEPINFMRKTSTLVPTPLYTQYKQQAQELNEITRRLKAIVKAIKFRGAYNSTIEGIEKVLAADDNQLVPVENVQSMPDGMGIDKMLWTVPTNELATTAQSLYQQREQIKATIYEITGISDILRGASAASETATAQNIKNQWGSLRLKKMQKQVQRYCRDAIKIMLEIAAAKFEQQTFQQMTGLPFLTEMQKAQIGQQMQMQQLQYQQVVQQAQMAGQQPPPEPQIPPELQAQMAQPTWDQILSVMRNDISLSYKCDIETNSTIDAEAAQDKQDIAELMNAISQFLNGVAPLVQNGTLPFEVAQAMLLSISRRFNFGPQLEDSLMKMQAPKPEEDPGKAEEAEMKKAEMAMKTQEFQQKMQLEAQQHKDDMELAAFDRQTQMMLANLKRQEVMLQQQSLEQKMAFQAAQHRQKMQAMQMKAATTPEPSGAE